MSQHKDNSYGAIEGHVQTQEDMNNYLKPAGDAPLLDKEKDNYTNELTGTPNDNNGDELN